ncbi:hypothetical protein [Colwellia sp. UCD-KL20]|uniref:hypothetical protein n=1 Tax=Colwellia sp. UCD-KL20 TaxID=1917165 RepID=UPI0009708BD3|nr:hypothetical protein [Colwellia sp. UCD-KL20]
MEIVLSDDLQDYQPDSFYIIHLVILCASLKYCLGASKSMSFKKLSYVFDNVLKKEGDHLQLKKTLLPWDIEGYFRKSLILANAENYLELISKNSMLTVVLTDHGEHFVSSVELSGHFLNYIELIKSVRRKETEFSKFNLGCAVNEY